MSYFKYIGSSAVYIYILYIYIVIGVLVSCIAILITHYFRQLATSLSMGEKNTVK